LSKSNGIKTSGSKNGNCVSEMVIASQ